MQYGFVGGWESSCFSAVACENARFLVHQSKDVEMHLIGPPLLLKELQRQELVQDTFISTRS